MNFNPPLPMLAPTQVVDPEIGGFYESHLPTFWQVRRQWRMQMLNVLWNLKAIDFKTYTNIRQPYPKGFHIHRERTDMAQRPAGGTVRRR